MLACIAALTPRRVIGLDNRLPWHLPADLRHFKAVTMGKPIVMGRKTYQSIGRPLPGRANLVLSRDPALSLPGCGVLHSVQEVLALAAREPEVLCIGGAEIYRLLLPHSARLYLTWVEADLAGDSYFPALDPAAWREVTREAHAPDEKNPYPYCFTQWERRA